MPPITDSFAAAAALAAKSADETEAAGRLPAAVVDALVEAEAFRLWIPGKHGGLDGTVADGLDAIEHLARHDGSAGWCLMIGLTTSLNSGFLPDEFASEIYGPAGAITGGFGMPAGEARTTDGGVLVTGEWAWGSGSSHCTHFGGGVRFPNRPGSTFVYFDMADVDFLDTWHVAGLEGTASRHYRTTDAFVPEGRWVDFADNSEPLSENPLYRFSFLGSLALGVSSVAIGLAFRAIDELVLLGEKQPAGSSRSLAERATIQADLARAEGKARSARAFVREIVAQCWDAAATDGRMTDEHKRSLRLAANHATSASAECVDLCYHAAGGTAVYRTSPLQRVFRDIHVATQHGMVAPRVLEPLGRLRFGLPTSTAQF